MSISAYIHIPFCAHKCDFCDFPAFAGLNHLEDEYCHIVEQEITQRLKSEPMTAELGSIFYGGGTPGLVGEEKIRRLTSTLLTHLKPAEHMEIELETTPQSITSEKACAWVDLGVTRLSIGVESLIDEELVAIGRVQTRADAFSGIKMATEAGFDNINCDLMYALPTQTLASWQRSLMDLLNLAGQNRSIKHISAYSLHLDGHSSLLSRFPKHSSAYPTEELYIEMYEELIKMMTAHGFEQYEVSNFCRPGYQSKHNLSYWNGSEYLAFGVGAHRYVNGIRTSNFRSLARYMQNPLGDETHEVIDRETRIKESIMLALRLRQGLDLSAFQSTYGIDLASTLAEKIDRLIAGGFLERQGKMLLITQKGVPVSNTLIAELF